MLPVLHDSAVHSVYVCAFLLFQCRWWLRLHPDHHTCDRGSVVVVVVVGVVVVFVKTFLWLWELSGACVVCGVCEVCGGDVCVCVNMYVCEK